MRIAALTPDLVPAILAMQRVAAPGRAWSHSDAQAIFFDRAHASGAHVVVALDRDGAVAGVAGWVAIGVARGEFYGSPVVAPGKEAAGLLVARLVAEADRAGAAWVRISAHEVERAKRDALRAAGFHRVFDLVDVNRPLDEEDLCSSQGAVPVPGLRIVTPDGPERVPAERSAIDLAAHVELYNDCFADIPNAPPIDVGLADEEWSRESVHRGASLALYDGGGRERGFVLATRGGEVEAIGVDAALRGRSLGRWLLGRTLHVLARSGVPTARARIASTNRASLALFAAAGFTVAARLPIYHRDLERAGASAGPHATRE